MPRNYYILSLWKFITKIKNCFKGTLCLVLNFSLHSSYCYHKGPQCVHCWPIKHYIALCPSWFSTEKPCYLFTLSGPPFGLLGELIELKHEEHLNNEQISIAIFLFFFQGRNHFIAKSGWGRRGWGLFWTIKVSSADVETPTLGIVASWLGHSKKHHPLRCLVGAQWMNGSFFSPKFGPLSLFPRLWPSHWAHSLRFFWTNSSNEFCLKI